MNDNLVEYGGFWIRFVAHIIDQIVLGIINSFLFIPLFLIFGLSFFPFNEFGDFNDFSTVSIPVQYYEDDQTTVAFFMLIVGIIILSLVSTIIQWLYYAIMEASSKQGTLGKMAVGIKVTDLDGNRITFGRATGRYFAKILSGLILMIGYIMAAFTDKKQALHDMLANTLVIKSN